MKKDHNEKNIDMKPGFARCRYCHQQFSMWRVKRRHEIDMVCIQSDDFVRINRKGVHHELVWGDQILIHSCMSI